MSGVRIGRAFRGKMRLRVTIALVLLLIAVLCVWFFIRAQRLDALSAHVIEIYMDNHLTGRIDAGWLANLESVDVEIRGESITCVSLIDALDSMDARPTSQETVVIEGNEGAVSIPAEAILPRFGAYIIYQSGGKPLSVENGGPYRVMALMEDGGDVSVSGVEKITIQLME